MRDAGIGFVIEQPPKASGSLSSVRRRHAAHDAAFSVFVKWVAGFFIATGIVWVYGLFFLSDARPKYFDPLVKRWVEPPGRTYRIADEGWGSVTYGPHGIQSAMPRDGQPLVVFWGDSFAEGMGGVRPEQKMEAVVTELGRALRPSPVAISTGVHGDRASEIYFGFQHYRSVLPRPSLNVYLVNPHNFVVNGTTIHAEPGQPVFTETFDTAYASRRRVWNVLAKLRANFITTGILEAMDRGTVMRFRIGPATPEARKGIDDVAFSYEQLVREIRALKDAVNGPLLILLRPDLPRLFHDRIYYADPNAACAEAIRAACEREHVDFIYPIERFRRFTRETNLIPVGFRNTKPDEGHFNEHGHRLIAETVIDYLLQHGYARQ
jgi:lysophospholipase L1-like esterase